MLEVAIASMKAAKAGPVRYRENLDPNVYVYGAKEKKPEPKAEPQKKVSTGDPEVDKIIEEGYKYLHELRDVNIRIPDEVMTKRIDRMEVASADIFAYIAEHPEKAAEIRRFMNYYLPTTLKLLNSYDKLSRQRVKGENIQKTMFEIEGMMETIAGAFEKQLDSLFDDDALDIAARHAAPNGCRRHAAPHCRRPCRSAGVHRQ